MRSSAYTEKWTDTGRTGRCARRFIMIRLGTLLLPLTTWTHGDHSFANPCPRGKSGDGNRHYYEKQGRFCILCSEAVICGRELKDCIGEIKTKNRWEIHPVADIWLINNYKCKLKLWHKTIMWTMCKNALPLQTSSEDFSAIHYKETSLMTDLCFIPA